LRTLIAAIVILQAAPASAVRHVGLHATTDLPFLVGARLDTERADRVRLSLGWSVVPGGYTTLLGAIANLSAGATTEQRAVMEGVLNGAQLWRLQAGWRPLRRRGFYFEAGYALMRIDGAFALGELDSCSKSPAAALCRDERFLVDASVHMATVELGWEWVAYQALVLRASLGFLATFAVSNEVAPEPRLRQAVEHVLLTAQGDQLTEELNTLLLDFGFVPMISLSAGYRF
jgi:hypothetical protein